MCQEFVEGYEILWRHDEVRISLGAPSFGHREDTRIPSVVLRVCGSPKCRSLLRSRKPEKAFPSLLLEPRQCLSTTAKKLRRQSNRIVGLRSWNEDIRKRSKKSGNTVPHYHNRLHLGSIRNTTGTTLFFQFRISSVRQ